MCVSGVRSTFEGARGHRRTYMCGHTPVRAHTHIQIHRERGREGGREGGRESHHRFAFHLARPRDVFLIFKMSNHPVPLAVSTAEQTVGGGFIQASAMNEMDSPEGLG